MPPGQRTTIKFDLPEIKSKTIQARTKVVYRSHLNCVARQGYTTIESLQEDAKHVINFIKETKKNVGEQKVVLFAIFYALADTDYIKSPNPYYEFLQTLKTPQQKEWEEKEKPKWLEEKAKASKESPLGVPLAS